MTYFTKVFIFMGCLSSLALSHITIENAWARPGHKGKNTAVYFDIITDEKDISLNEAQSNAGRLTEIHTHIHENGIMKMRQISALPCTGTTSLKPGGDHIMLMDLNDSLKEGDTTSLTLTFSNGHHHTMTVPVRKPKV